jgi:hypothetical protein
MMETGLILVSGLSGAGLTVPGENQTTQTQLSLVQAMKNSYCGQVTFE